MLGQIRDKAQSEPKLICMQVAVFLIIFIPFIICLSLFSRLTAGDIEAYDFGIPDHTPAVEAVILSVDSSPTQTQPSLSILSRMTLPSHWMKPGSDSIPNTTFIYGIGPFEYKKTDLVTVNTNVRMESGSIARYPFDEYTIDLPFLILQEPINEIPELNLFLRVNLQNGWAFEIDKNAVGFNATERDEAYHKTVRIKIRRSNIFKLYPVFMILAFWCVTLVILYYGCCVLIWDTKNIEAGLVTAMISFLFAIPSFRNTAPQSPPIGCLMDFASFYWTMLTIIIFAVLIIIKYVNLGKPGAAPPAPKKDDAVPLNILTK